MANHLVNQTSPYLLQHAQNPVDWYPWSAEAFAKAKAEDKPVFVSIGYSTCHWCHVMARESFEDGEIADILNACFVSVKVDREERPDLDSVYMAVCQAFTGSGGWPTSIWMTPEQKPFYAGTYYPKTSRRGAPGLKEVLLALHEAWDHERDVLLLRADDMVAQLNQTFSAPTEARERLPERAVEQLKRSFDEAYGGFGDAPKFPMPHQLLFLLQRYRRHGDHDALRMAEKTLTQMARGGLFDQIGYGFCRYATDRRFLIPHFEKMLYDNALLIWAYAAAYEATQKPFYRDIAEKTANYVLSEMQAQEGGFSSAQDADSDGEEGRFYTFDAREIPELLGEEVGAKVNAHFGITREGNFEGKSIPNLLGAKENADCANEYLPRLRAYRKARTTLRTDDKILTSWNALMITALCALYRITRRDAYLAAAQKALRFLQTRLCEGDTLFVSWRDGQRSGKGFLDEYACCIAALLALYGATLDDRLLDRAARLTGRTVADFFDVENGGFYLYGKDGEALIARLKETQDAALPSGNAVMTCNLVTLCALTPDGRFEAVLDKQLRFVAGEAEAYPAGYAMSMIALSDALDPPTTITAVRGQEPLTELPFFVPTDTLVRVLDEPTATYPLLDGHTTYYVCRNHSCLPPMHSERFFGDTRSREVAMPWKERTNR